VKSARNSDPFMDAAREMFLPGLIESIVGPKD
jgi:hypothetical protein